MPRTPSLGARQIAYAESSDDGEIELITIDPSFGSPSIPLRFARNPVDVTSNGDVYTAFDFRIVAPQALGDGTATQSKLEIDAVDRRMVEALRQITTPMTLVHQAVLISDPDTVIYGPWSYEIRGEQAYDALSLDLALTFEPVLEEQIPSKQLSPSRAPGLF